MRLYKMIIQRQDCYRFISGYLGKKKICARDIIITGGGAGGESSLLSFSREEKKNLCRS